MNMLIAAILMYGVVVASYEQPSYELLVGDELLQCLSCIFRGETVLLQKAANGSVQVECDIPPVVYNTMSEQQFDAFVWTITECRFPILMSNLTGKDIKELDQGGWWRDEIRSAENSSGIGHPQGDMPACNMTEEMSFLLHQQMAVFEAGVDNITAYGVLTVLDTGADIIANVEHLSSQMIDLVKQGMETMILELELLKTRVVRRQQIEGQR